MDERKAEVKVSDEGSDLADIDEVEESLNDVSDGSLSQPSPRRLRSKETASDQGKEKIPVVNVGARSQRMITRSQRRVSDSRNVKRVTRSSRRGVWELSGQVQRKDSLEEQANTLEIRGDEESEESESEEEGEEAGEETGEEDEDGKEDGDRAKNDAEEVDVEEEEKDDDDDEEEEEEREINLSILQVEDETDELVSSASTTPLMSQSRRTPLRKRLRPRTRNACLTLDDSAVEDGSEEDEGETTCSEEREVADEIRVYGEESMDVDETAAAKPQKLKTDRIVGENKTAEEDIGEEDSETREEEEVGGDTVDADGGTDKVMKKEGVYAFGASSFAYELISV